MTPAGVITILHNFEDGTVTDDGGEPAAALVQGRDGNFYGTTQLGGSGAGGTVFQMTPSGTLSILHNFVDGSVTNDGQNPVTPLIQASDGYLYGTTTAGGSAHDGAIFRLTPLVPLTIVHSFGDGSVTNDGKEPYAGLFQGSDGNFYGTTFAGGSATEGTVFEMTPSFVVTILHSFDDGSVTNDGENPTEPLMQASDGNFYGTTPSDSLEGEGSLYEVTLEGEYSSLYNMSFDGLGHGESPHCAFLQASNGTLYATTSLGGTEQNGTVFSYDLGLPAPRNGSEGPGYSNLLWRNSQTG
jgi:uncharacterized repeat protein (TIGR03803 family)